MPKPRQVCRDNALELYKCDLLNAFSRYHFSLDADMETYFATITGRTHTSFGRKQPTIRL
jgi:hypothetical protein